MFSRQILAKPFLILVGLMAASYINAAPPALTLSPGTPVPPSSEAANGTSKPDPAAIHCALSQYVPWVRAQSSPLNPDLKAKKLQEIDRACGSSLRLSNVTAAYDSPESAVQADDPPRMRPGFYQLKTNGGVLDNNQKGDGPVIMRLCFTQAMLDKMNPVTGQSGDCTPRKAVRKGNQTRSEMNCSRGGITITGTSVETVDGNTRTVVADVTTSGGGSLHTIHLDAEFTFLGADCSATNAPAAAP